MKIAVATCADKPDLLEGDRLFVAELAKLGIEAAPLIWTDFAQLDQRWDAVLVRSIWDYYKRYDLFLDWLARAEKKSFRLLNGAATIRWNADKNYLKDLTARGVDVVPTRFFPRGTDAESVRREMQGSGWRDVIVKPAVSGSAFLTTRASLDDDSFTHAIHAARDHADLLVQPYLPSIEEGGEVSLIFFHGAAPEFSHATRKVPARGDFRVQSEHGGAMEAFTPGAELVALAAATLRDMPGDWVFARVDLVDWRTRPLLGELEVLEPDLYLQYDERAPARFARALAEKLRAR